MRYPHHITLLRPTGDVYNPFAAEGDIAFDTVYEGACRCDMGIRTRLRAKSVMDADYQVYIPNAAMPYATERDEVRITFPLTTDCRVLRGAVKDFVRYDRNCIIYFNVIKEPNTELN